MAHEKAHRCAESDDSGALVKLTTVVNFLFLRPRFTSGTRQQAVLGPKRFRGNPNTVRVNKKLTTFYC